VKHKLLVALRRQIRRFSWFKVELLAGGRERQTCSTCGHVAVSKAMVKVAAPLAAKLTAYRNQGRGIHGRCPGCERIARDERYPLR